ncbi:Nucleobase cation symporter 2 family - like 5 [Theobroma cacao]|nr:Nucleobase cation symporter 2 family - like 5 [Theobroma cacao]
MVFLFHHFSHYSSVLITFLLLLLLLISIHKFITKVLSNKNKQRREQWQRVEEESPMTSSPSLSKISSLVLIFASPALLIGRFKQSMRDVQGALIVASFFTMVIGFFGFWGIFARFLSPLAAVPLVILTGLGLYAHGFPQLAKCIEVGLPALVAVVFLSQRKCRSFGINKSWKSESRSNIGNIYALLFCIRYDIPY